MEREREGFVIGKARLVGKFEQLASLEGSHEEQTLFTAISTLMGIFIFL